MKYAIDVLYLDAHSRVVGVEQDLKPGRIGRIHKHVDSVIELPAGKVSETQTEVGQVIIFS